MVQIKKVTRSLRRRSSHNKSSSLWRFLQCVIGFSLFYLFVFQSLFSSDDEHTPHTQSTHTQSKNINDLNVNYQRNLENEAGKARNKNKTEKQEPPMELKQVLESSKQSVSQQQKPDPPKPKVQVSPLEGKKVSPLEGKKVSPLEGKKLVHVIHTRFMQNQPTLVMLGKARLKLFETFCLPTIVHQRNQEFLWIIRTDPELHEDLKSGMLELLTDVPNVAFVGSNEVRKGAIDGGFRSADAISDIVEESLLFGSMELVKAYYEAAKVLTLLETNLDADDGLATTFVGKAQEVSMELFIRNDDKQRKKLRRMNSSWMTLCVGRHAEWQFYAPYDPKTEKGSFTKGSTHVCITPGLTHASQSLSVPQYTESHHWIKKKMPECRHETANGNDIASPSFLDPDLHEDMGCWMQLPTNDPYKDLMAIRARTPTSTGMSRVVTSESAFTQEDITTDAHLWSKITSGSVFRITRDMIRGAHQFIEENMASIVEENLEGQCRNDHSCSEGIKKKLKSILFKDGDFKNKHGMVHVIQTAIESPMTVDVWRHFCLESMEVQTTYEFLWIIRIKDYDANPQISEAVHNIQMLKILEKSSLNIIIIKSDGTPSMDFRQMVAIADITNESLLYGSFSTLYNFHNAAQNSTLLETTVDPTEAISKTFVEDMQKSVAVQKEYGQENAKFAWYYRCESKFLEWNYFHVRGTDEANMGFSRMNDELSDRCGNNPATTRISMPGAEIPFFADISQAEKCQTMVVLRIENGCFVPIENEELVVARAVIPDSIEKPAPSKLSEVELVELEEADNHLSTMLRYSFNILPYSINIIHEHIQESQCGDGSVCNSKLDSDYGVVHIIQTWIPGPDYFDIWRNFCFSIELQTSKKFLWIIRIPSEADAAFIHKVAKPLNKTPLNVIIVKSSRAPEANFRQNESIADITTRNLVRGDMETVEYFHKAAKEKPLLETTLHATDALAKTFIDDVQKIVSTQVKQKELNDAERGWYYQCASDFVEWNFHNPRGGDTDNGFLNAVPAKFSNCLEHPGVTRVSLPTVKTSRKSAGKECTSKRGGFVDGCFSVVLKQKEQVARVSVPKVIHGGMKKDVEEETFQQLVLLNKKLTGHLKHNFGIFPVSMKAMRKRIEEAGVQHHGLRGIGQKVLTSSETWINSRDIVHVVHTRLLQHQPTMLVLGKVRLDMFKTLCAATISQQTNKEFLWIIRTDPELDSALKQNLFQALEGLSNVVVVASGDGKDGIYNGEFRERYAMREFTNNSIMYGNLTLVQSYHEAAKTHILLETNVDSDDGVTLTFVDNLQAVALESFEYDSFKVGWVNICLGRHLEWHFYAPWQKKSEKGCLMLGSTRNCVRSGLSWAVNVNAKPKFMTDTHLIKENKEQCTMNRTAADRLIQECWDEVPLADADNDVTAIRSMTPASKGLARGEVSKFDYNIAALTYDGEAWDLLEAYFGVNAENIKESRAMIVDNMQEVLHENDRSVCTHRKTCVGHWQNKYRLVHVLQVSIFDPNIVDVFRRVALSAMVGQTSSEFLLIVRIEDFTDKRLTDTIYKGIVDSAIVNQILLVQSNRTTTATFRSKEAISDITDETLLHGSMAVLKDYHEAAKSRPLLETHLKPYEGFKRDYMEELHNATATHQLDGRVQSGEAGWYYQCVPAFVERKYFSPSGAEEKNGYYYRNEEGQCVKRPGTTRVSFPEAKIPSDTKLTYAQECSSNEDESDLGGGCYILSVSEIVPAIRVLTDLVGKKVEMEDEKIQELDKQQFGILREIRADFSVFPPTLKSMRKEVQENEREIVHIIHSSLHDPTLINPWRNMLMDSLQLQTSKNFLYILRSTNFTNPKDMHDVMYPMSGNHEKGHIDIFLVDSDYVPAADFRTPEAIADITDATLLRGDMNHLIELHKAAGARTVVETFLGPTEGVASSFVGDLQENVLNQLKQNQMQGVQLVRNDDYGKRTNWYYDCNSEFVEWSYHSLRGEDAEIGFLKLITAAHESNCVNSPGTTRITLPGSTVPSTSIFKRSSGQLCPSDTLKDGCYIPNKVHDETKIAMAIIPETTENAVPSSLPEFKIKKLEDQDKLLSKMLADSFNISPYSMEIMRKRIHDRECESGEKVCTAELDSQYGVVHVFQTSLQDPEMFEAWRKFCFSLEAQTTRKFLWILRVVADEKLMKMVCKPLNKTPLNIIVVESSESPTVDFRHPDAIADITKERIRHGKIEILQHFHERAKDRPLLETFLGVTDSLSLTFANDLQRSTPEIIKENKVADAPNAWYYQCVPKFITWSYFTPRGDATKSGSLRIIADDPGKCIDRPGTTRISLPNAKISTASGGLTACAGKPVDGCYSPFKTKRALAARMIMPESLNPEPEAGLREDDFERLEKDQERLGKLMKDDFSVPPISRTQLQKKVKEMLEKKFAK